MAGDIKDWDTTAANNNSTPPDGFPENMDYSDVNDSARELMAVVARWYADMNGTLDTTGAADTYAVTLNESTVAAYYDGLHFVAAINATNTGASTINVNTIGAKAIKDAEGNDLAAGALVAGQPYLFMYDGTNFRILGIVPGDVVTLTGTETLTNKTLTAPTITSPSFTSGDLALSSGVNINPASGNGIDYTAAGGGVLSFFNEGTFTPFIADADLNASEGQTHTNQEGDYQKLGVWVEGTIDLTWTGIGTLNTSGDAYVGGLPEAATEDAIVEIGGLVGVDKDDGGRWYGLIAAGSSGIAIKSEWLDSAGAADTTGDGPVKINNASYPSVTAGGTMKLTFKYKGA